VKHQINIRNQLLQSNNFILSNQYEQLFAIVSDLIIFFGEFDRFNTTHQILNLDVKSYLYYIWL